MPVRLIGRDGSVLIEGHLAVACQLDELVMSLDTGRWRLDDDDGTIATHRRVMRQPQAEDQEQPEPEEGAG